MYVEQSRSEVYPFLPADASSYLDVGCGTGGFGRLVRLRRGPDVRIVGIDALPEATDRARKAGYDCVIEGYFPGAVDDVSEKYDCIIFNDVLEHTIDPWTLLAEARHHLSPTGSVVASIPNIRYLPVLYRLAKGRWDYTECGTLDRTHLRFFTKATMIEMFEEAGLRVVRVAGINNEWDFPRWRRLGRLAAWTGDLQWLQFVLVGLPKPECET